VTRQFAVLIGWQGAMLAGLTLIAFWFGLKQGGDETDSRRAGTIAFMTLALGQTFHAFNTRSETQSAFGKGFFRNAWLWGAVLICVLLQGAAVFIPFLRGVLHTEMPSGMDWLIIVVCSLSPIAIVEVVKIFQRQIKMRTKVRAAESG
jgi:Ca2+-transporting ATPase